MEEELEKLPAEDSFTVTEIVTEEEPKDEILYRKDSETFQSTDDIETKTVAGESVEHYEGEAEEEEVDTKIHKAKKAKKNVAHSVTIMQQRISLQIVQDYENVIDELRKEKEWFRKESVRSKHRPSRIEKKHKESKIDIKQYSFTIPENEELSHELHIEDTEQLAEEEPEVLGKRENEVLKKQRHERSKYNQRLGLPGGYDLKKMKSAEITKLKKEFGSLLNLFEQPITSIESALDLSSSTITEEGQAEEDESKVLRVKDRHIDRLPLLIKVDQLQKQISLSKRKNGVLSDKITHYFKSHGRSHLLEVDNFPISSSMQKYYEGKLMNYENLRKEVREKYQKTKEDINQLTMKNGNLQAEAQEALENLEKAAREVSMKYVVAASKSINVDKKVERLLQQQSYQIDNLHKIRIKHLLIQDKIRSLDKKLRILNDLGEHSILDYEKLTTKNRTLRDKMEDQDSELKIRRKRLLNDTQMAANLKEKLVILNDDLHIKSEELTAITKTCRECKNNKTLQLKNNSKLRIEIEKIIQGSGLIHRPKLLKDMEKSTHLLLEYEKELEDLIEDCTALRKQNNLLRAHIKQYEFEKTLPFK